MATTPTTTTEPAAAVPARIAVSHTATDVPRTVDAFNSPWFTLSYLIFVFVPLLFVPQLSTRAVLLSLLAAAIFVPIHLHEWERGRQRPLLAIGVTLLLGLALIPFNPGGNTFIIYVMAMAGARLPPRRATQVGLFAWLLMTLEFSWLGYGFEATAAYAGMTLVVGGMVLLSTIFAQAQERQNAQLRLSQEEVKRLAALAERERIGRDLHDLLGHTLSLVVLKSELAGKLLDRDATAARQQIREVETVARHALAEVRQAVSGIRQSGLLAEVAACRLALLSADIELAVRMAPLQIANEVEAVLALSLREATTNVLRHARASQVTIELDNVGEELRLRIEDDGCGDNIQPGNGLRGMRERLGSINARLDIGHPSDAGTRLTILVPAPWRAHANALAEVSK
ncbi:MAG: sensor histidine kinase [Pseudomarimonas sp.]